MMNKRKKTYYWCNMAAIAMLLLGFASMVGMVTRTGDIMPPSGVGAVVGMRLFLRRWPSLEGFEFWYIWPLLVLPLFGGVFSYVLRQRIMRAAHRGRVCYHCGRDLSRVQDSRRCPECGMEFEP